MVVQCSIKQVPAKLIQSLEYLLFLDIIDRILQRAHLETQGRFLPRSGLKGVSALGDLS
jgi:hypothetical protein